MFTQLFIFWYCFYLIIFDITFFFIHIKTENNEKITISNTVILQKTISIVLSHNEGILK